MLLLLILQTHQCRLIYPTNWGGTAKYNLTSADMSDRESVSAHSIGFILPHHQRLLHYVRPTVLVYGSVVQDV